MIVDSKSLYIGSIICLRGFSLDSGKYNYVGHLASKGFNFYNKHSLI